MEAVDRTVAIAKAVFKLAVKIWLMWPRLDLTSATRVLNAPPRLSHDKPGRDWAEWSGLWRCR
eukprot:4996364-Pyramimonas_sp.AAC.1